MRKLILTFLIAAVLLANVVYNGVVVDAETLIHSSDETHVPGVVMGKDDFKDIFSGGDNTRTRSPKSLPIEESAITLSDVSIKENNLSVNVTIRENGTAVTLPLCGSLAASYKTHTELTVQSFRCTA